MSDEFAIRTFEDVFVAPQDGTCYQKEAGKKRAMIPHEYIEELNRRTDIVDLVGSYVQLKRKGRLYGGLCPFHSEKTPSFYVYPDTQSFYCFGCGAGGDAISFAKKINSIDYGEAVKMLAARAGMPEPQEDDKTGRMRSRILSMNREAARFFHACLNSTVEEARQARAYWRRRGLDDKTIVRFGLGYAPNDGQALYQFLRDKGLQPAGAGRQRPVQAQRFRAHLLFVLEAGHDPHLRPARQHHRVRRACAG